MENTNEKLYEEAKNRIAFRNHAITYTITNVLIWIFWYFTRAQYGHYDGYWPIYPTIGWGIGLISHYVGIKQYSEYSIAKEMEKIKKERGLV